MCCIFRAKIKVQPFNISMCIPLSLRKCITMKKVIIGDQWRWWLQSWSSRQWQGVVLLAAVCLLQSCGSIPELTVYVTVTVTVWTQKQNTTHWISGFCTSIKRSPAAFSFLCLSPWKRTADTTSMNILRVRRFIREQNLAPPPMFWVVFITFLGVQSYFQYVNTPRKVSAEAGEFLAGNVGNLGPVVYFCEINWTKPYPNTQLCILSRMGPKLQQMIALCKLFTVSNSDDKHTSWRESYRQNLIWCSGFGFTTKRLHRH